MDVIELGRPDRIPRGGPRGPRRGRPLGVVAILVLGAVGYAATRPDSPAARTEPSPSPVVVVPPLETVPITEEPVEPTVEPTPPPDPYLGEWLLPRLRERTGLAFASADGTFTVMDVDTGRLTRTEMPGGDSEAYVEPVGRIAGGWLVIQRTPCGDFPCSPASVIAVRGTRVNFVANAHDATLDPDGRTVWLIGVPDDATDVDTPQWLERRTFDGTLVGPRTTLRSQEDVIGVTPRGPLVRRYQGKHTYLLERMARARREVLTGRPVVAVAGNEVATMTDGCTEWPGVGDCRIAVENVATGRSRGVGRLTDRPHSFALDPTGRYVAVSFETGAMSVRVYDISTGRDLFVEGLTFPPLATGMTWSPDGRWLVLTTSEVEDGQAGNGTRVAVWRPGFDTAYAVPTYEGVFTGRIVAAAAR